VPLTRLARRAGEWRNAALAPVGVIIDQGCHSAAACAGVVAWRVNAQPQLLPSLVPTTATAVAFTIEAATATAVTQIRGDAPTGSTVSIFSRSGDSLAAPGALSSPSGWTQLWTGTWPAAAPVTLTTPLALAAGGVATLLVISSGGVLTCAHTLGNISAVLLADDVLTLWQGGSVAAALAPGAALTGACAWGGLQLEYTSAAACPPPAPPPLPRIATSAPVALVGSLDDLLRALADLTVRALAMNIARARVRRDSDLRYSFRCRRCASSK
jgi:hypothetical protein